MPQPAIIIVATCLTFVSLAAQNHVVAPQAYATTDAPAYGWVAGASRDVRQQTLIGASHLAPLLGKTITSIALRRHAAAEQYLNGKADLTVTLSIAPGSPLDCSTVFATNTTAPTSPAAPNFTGQVDIPLSPTPGGATVPWTTPNIIEIPLTTSFTYTGGTLCVDITGAAVAGHNANWWMADLALEDISGDSHNLGGGCGIYGGVSKDWSHVAERSLIAGGHARFFANGTPGAPGLAVFGNAALIGIPLSLTGLPAGPGCNIWLSSLDVLIPITFSVPTDPIVLPFGGEAEVTFKVPNSPTTLGITMTTQWIDWAQLATSNAIEWTIAPSMPTMDMALIEGAAGDPSGLAAPYMGHVMRFTHQ
jgi:hypothetical protein